MTPHDLCRTLGTQLFKAGTPAHVVQGMMGHESHETTQVYNLGDAEEEMLEASKTLPL